MKIKLKGYVELRKRINNLVNHVLSKEFVDALNEKVALEIKQKSEMDAAAHGVDVYRYYHMPYFQGFGRKQNPYAGYKMKGWATAEDIINDEIKRHWR